MAQSLAPWNRDCHLPDSRHPLRSSPWRPADQRDPLGWEIPTGAVPAREGCARRTESESLPAGLFLPPFAPRVLQAWGRQTDSFFPVTLPGNRIGAAKSTRESVQRLQPDRQPGAKAPSVRGCRSRWPG